MIFLDLKQYCVSASSTSQSFLQLADIEAKAIVVLAIFQQFYEVDCRKWYTLISKAPQSHPNLPNFKNEISLRVHELQKVILSDSNVPRAKD